MSNTIGSYPTLASRAFSQEELRQLRAICDEHKFSYGTFCSLIIRDVLQSEDLVEKYIHKVQQFEEDQRPASVEEMKVLRQKLRQQEEELEALREFKQAAQL